MLPGYVFLIGALTNSYPILADRASMHPACFNRADSERRFVLQVSEKHGENVVVTETRVQTVTSNRNASDPFACISKSVGRVK